jgi:hypothetical protein
LAGSGVMNGIASSFSKMLSAQGGSGAGRGHRPKLPSHVDLGLRGVSVYAGIGGATQPGSSDGMSFAGDDSVQSLRDRYDFFMTVS